MNDAVQHSEGLLIQAIQEAAAVAQARVNRAVSVTDASEPSARTLLRFDLAFANDAVLSWFVGNDDATGLSDLLVGGTGDRSVALTETHLDALSEVFDMMLGRCVESLNTHVSPPLNTGGLDMRVESALPGLETGDACIIRSLNIDGLEPMTVVTIANAALVQLMAASMGQPVTGQLPPVDQTRGVGVESATGRQSVASVPTPDLQQAAQGAPDNVVHMQRETGASGDLSMLLNVPLDISVELGNTARSVRELLELSVGSILELNKLAGDAMDIRVNGKVLARGEVVVIDEEFGIRITEILTPEQRLRTIG